MRKFIYTGENIMHVGFRCFKIQNKKFQTYLWICFRSEYLKALIKSMWKTAAARRKPKINVLKKQANKPPEKQ